MREYASNFAIVLCSFSTLFLIFTFFELIGPIFRNRTPLIIVGEYLITLIPFILYNVTPLCALVAVLVTFGALNRTSEITAMKASGISLYRIITPVLFVTMLISVGLFAFDEIYLPGANRRQEALLSVIKDKPAQTFSRPDRQWISGQTNVAGQPMRIFYYQFFNAERDVFANLTVFEFDPVTFLPQAADLRYIRHAGIRRSIAGSSTTAGNAPSRARRSPATNDLQSLTSPRSRSSPLTSRRRHCPHRR